MSDCLRRILDELAALIDDLDPRSIGEVSREIRGAKRIFIAGLGRSGLMARAFAMRLTHLGLDVHVVGETTTPEISADDLLICCSRRGESGSQHHFIDLAHGAGARAAVFTASPDSTVALLSDVVVALPKPGAAPSQPLGTLFEQMLLLVLDALVVRLMADLDVNEEAMQRKHTSLE